MARRPKIVLINPPSEVWREGTSHLLPILNTLPQIGIAALAAVLTEKGFDVEIIDAQALGITHLQAIDWAVARRPAIAGLTGYTSSIDQAARIAGGIKERLPRCVTVVGGPHVTAIPERTLAAFPQFDLGLVGEGEASTPLLFRAILERDDHRSVPGVVYREGGATRAVRRPPLIADLDELPPPAYGMLPGFPHAYHPPIFHSPSGRAITLVTSRGCPYRCAFCDRALFGNRFRVHGVPYIIDIISRLVKEYGIGHFIFYDDNFTADRKHLFALCEALAKLPFRITFSCDARADLVDRETLGVMKRAGAWMISYGIETANPALLALLKKSLGLERAAEAVRLTRQSGILTKGLFMIGLPGETEETIKRTKDFVMSLPFDLINLSKFTPYPGCEIYDEIGKYGEFEEVWERMNAMNFVFWPSTIGRETLAREADALLRDFYRSPKRWRGIIRLMRNGRDALRLLLALSYKVRHMLVGLIRPSKRGRWLEI
jgi:anaerobic magnesium-protoporphyrin IX monomethyl ester cyclase